MVFKCCMGNLPINLFTQGAHAELVNAIWAMYIHIPLWYFLLLLISDEFLLIKMAKKFIYAE